jgi:replication factor C small subunit
MKPSVWVERYRPKTLQDVIFQDDRQRSLFEKYIDESDIPNLMLTGIQGTGKSTVSKCLMTELKVDPSDVIKINASRDKMEAIRGRVDDFAWTMPIGKFKVVRLEEFDGLSTEGMRALRSLIEDTSSTCRFIGTCNYENKIIPPLKDRFQVFRFKAPDKEQIAARMLYILEAEKVDFEPEDLLTYIDAGYPSIRQIIQLLQQNTLKGKLLPANSATAMASDWKLQLIDLILKGNMKAARKLVCENASREEHEEIYTFLYQNSEKLQVKDHDSAIITIAEYAKSHALVADTELNLAACFIALGKL